MVGLAHQWDGEVKGKMGENAVLEGPLELAGLYGSGACGLATTLGAWSLVRLARRSTLQAVSSELLRTLVLANAMLIPLKLGVGSEWPDGRKISFLSGHFANTFALTTVLSRR